MLHEKFQHFFRTNCQTQNYSSSLFFNDIDWAYTQYRTVKNAGWHVFRTNNATEICFVFLTYLAVSVPEINCAI